MKKYELISNSKRRTGFDWLEVYDDNNRLVYNTNLKLWKILDNFDNVGDLPIKSLKAAIRHVENHDKIKSGWKLRMIKVVVPKNLSFKQWFNNVIEQPNKYADILVIEIR